MHKLTQPLLQLLAALPKRITLGLFGPITMCIGPEQDPVCDVSIVLIGEADKEIFCELFDN